MGSAFKYIRDNGGIDAEAKYTYEAKENKCRYDPKTKVATDSGTMKIPANDEHALQIAIATVGPVSVAIDCKTHSFRFYKHGIFDDTSCSCTKISHAVLVVGYGTEGCHDYWLVKNSWGVKWGDKGYIKMSRNKNNQCGIASAAVYPIV